MNRSLLIPGLCCIAAFAASLVTLYGAPQRERSFQGRPKAALRDAELHVVSHSIDAAEARLQPTDDVMQRLTFLKNEYLKPWRQWENSPSRMFSRARPSPIPSISAEIELATSETVSGDAVCLATITIHKDAQSQVVPCIFDCTTQRAYLFSDGQWLAQEEWLAQARLPGR